MKIRVPTEYIKDSFLKVTSQKLSELDKIEKTTALDYFTDPEVKGQNVWDKWKESRKLLGEEVAEKGNVWNKSNKNEDYRSYMESSKRLEELTKKIEDGVEKYKREYRLELEDLLYNDIVKARETIAFNIEETDKDIKDKQTQISILRNMVEKKSIELGPLNQISTEEYEAKRTVINELKDDIDKLLEEVKGLEEEKKTLLSLEKELGFESIEKRLISKQDKKKDGKEGEEKKDDKSKDEKDKENKDDKSKDEKDKENKDDKSKDKKDKGNKDDKPSKLANSGKQQGENLQRAQSAGQNNLNAQSAQGTAQKGENAQPTQEAGGNNGNAQSTQGEGQRGDNPDSTQGGRPEGDNPTPEQGEEMEKDIFKVILNSETGTIELSKWSSESKKHSYTENIKKMLSNKMKIRSATKDYLKGIGLKNYAGFMKKSKVRRRLNPAVLEVLRKKEAWQLLTGYIDAARYKDRNMIPFYYDIRLNDVSGINDKTYIKLNRRAIKDNRWFKTNFQGTIPFLGVKAFFSKVPLLKKLASVQEATKLLPSANNENSDSEKRGKKQRKSRNRSKSPREPYEPAREAPAPMEAPTYEENSIQPEKPKDTERNRGSQDSSRSFNLGNRGKTPFFNDIIFEGTDEDVARVTAAAKAGVNNPNRGEMINGTK